MEATGRITSRDALIVVDVQNDFCPGGALAVPDGDAVIAVIHRIAPRFEHVLLTQDWHPPGHCSFASSYPGKKPFEVVTLAGGFAVFALILASLGIYALISYSVTQRTSEIGIRVALGAQPADVFRILVGEGLRFALIGVAVGLVGALVFTRLLASFLYGPSASDPLIFSSVALLMIAICAAASFFPARRSTRVDPMVALRHE